MNVRQLLWTLLVALAVGAIVYVEALPVLFGWVVLALGLLVILWVSRLELGTFSLVLLAAFLTRAGLVLVHMYVTELPSSDFDAEVFNYRGWLMAQEGLAHVISQFNIGSGLYRWVVGIVYAILGEQSLMAMIGLNAIFGSLIVYNVYRLSGYLWGRHTAIRSAIAAAFFPTLVLYSALNLREVAAIYPYTLGCLYVARWSHTGRGAHLAAAAGGIAVGGMFHEGLFVGLLALIYAYVGTASSQQAKRWAAGPKGVIVGAAVIAVLLAVALTIGRDQVIARFAAAASWEVIADRQSDLAAGRAAYPGFLTISGPIDFLYKMPLRVAYFLYAPFIWMLRDTLDVVGFLDAMLVLGLTALIVRSRKVIWREPGTRALLLILVSTILLFALVVSNYGTAVRHRAKLVPLAICLVVAYPGGRKPGEIAHDPTHSLSGGPTWRPSP